MSNEQEKKGQETVKTEVVKIVYGFCRIPGGLNVGFMVDGEKQHIIFKSGMEKSRAGDNQTLIFTQKNDYGITEITKDQMELCKKEIEKSGIYRKGYIFFAESIDEGKKLAKQYLKLYATTGFERLTATDIEKLVEQFKKD